MKHTHLMRRAMWFLWSRVLPLPLIWFGIVGLGSGAHQIWLARGSTAWPTADGTITNSTVECHAGVDHDTYHARILYQFQVEGRTYTGKKVSFSDYGSGGSHAKFITDRYPKDKLVKVRYRPGDPSTCILEPGADIDTWVRPVLDLYFLVPGILMFIFLPRLRKRVEMNTEQAVGRDGS